MLHVRAELQELFGIEFVDGEVCQCDREIARLLFESNPHRLIHVDPWLDFDAVDARFTGRLAHVSGAANAQKEG
jgi:hypothetical protein